MWVDYSWGCTVASTCGQQKDIIPAIKTQLKCPSKALGPRSKRMWHATKHTHSDFELVVVATGLGQPPNLSICPSVCPFVCLSHGSRLKSIKWLTKKTHRQLPHDKRHETQLPASAENSGRRSAYWSNAHKTHTHTQHTQNEKMMRWGERGNWEQRKGKSFIKY